MPSAANAERFYPPATDDPQFVRWAHRIALLLVNLPPGAPEHHVRRVIFSEGTPGPEWADAMVFMMTLGSATSSASRTNTAQRRIT